MSRRGAFRRNARRLLRSAGYNRSRIRRVMRYYRRHNRRRFK